MSITSIGQTLSAYAAAQRRDRGEAAATAAAALPPAAPRFESLLRDGLQGTADRLRASEATAAEALGGNGAGGVQRVVEAVTEAELSLQKMTAIRDRVISAYQEIVRMPI